MNRHAELLLRHMQMLSAKYFDTAWESDLEFILFDVVAARPDRIGGIPVDRMDIQELANLFEMADGVWTGDPAGLVFVSWSVWEQQTGLHRRVFG